MTVGCGIFYEHTKHAKYGEHSELLQYKLSKDFIYMTALWIILKHRKPVKSLKAVLFCITLTLSLF